MDDNINENQNKPEKQQQQSTSLEQCPTTSQKESLPESATDSDVEVFDRIASKLIRSGMLLTALELHAELIERGKESIRLREFFDNPHNFEKHFDSSPTKKLVNDPTKASTSLFSSNKNLEREPSPSEKTFDSCDFTHYSDEDIERHGDERIAVLEFELRKAQQTINSLRASLTMSTTGVGSLDVNIDAGGESGITDSSINKNKLYDNLNRINADESYSMRDFYRRGSADGDSCPGEEFSKTSNNFSDLSNKLESGSIAAEKYSLASSIKPHEKRAINYLINEYLMANSYKLTSITFCDENADQDFDNWEDVGLNITRPPDLLKLYRNFWKNSLQQNAMSNNNPLITKGSNLKTDNKTILNDH